MPNNKYCNLDGNNEIKDEYNKINDGFAGVEADALADDTKHNNHVIGVTERHDSNHIDNASDVGGGTVTLALNALKALIENLDSVFSTDVERINAINQAVSDAFGADDTLEASLLSVIAGVQAQVTAHKDTDVTVHPSSKITFDPSGSTLTSVLVDLVIKELSVKVDANKTSGDNNLTAHQDSATAHGSSSITNQSAVTGSKVTDALNALKDSLAAIVANVTVDSEVILARNSAVKTIAYATLDARLEASETDIEGVKTPTYITAAEVTGSSASIPATANKGQLSVTVKGNTLKNELNYNRDTWAEWTKSAGGVGDNTGIELTFSDVASTYVYLSTNFKTVTKYGVLFNVVSNTLATKLLDFGGGTDLGATLNTSFQVSTGKLGNVRGVFTTGASIVNNRFRLVSGSLGDLGLKVKLKDIRIFELPAGSQIDSDFTNNTADQLAVKYPYIKGDTVKSTLSSRVKSVGKNLFDKFINRGKYVSSSTGSLVPQADRQASGFIRVKPITYTISTSTSLLDNIGVYDINKVWLRNISGNTLSSVSFTLSGNDAYIMFTVRDNNDNSLAMFNEGSSALPWECYTYTETYTPADIVQRSLPNGVKDEINVNTGEKIQRVSDSLIINGSSGWSTYGESGSTTSYYIRTADGWTTGKNILTDTLNSAIGRCADGDFPSASSSITTNGNRGIWFTGANGRMYISVDKTKIDAMAGADVLIKFKAYLDLYPVTLNYQLAVPIPTKLMPQILTAEPNGTIIVEPVFTDWNWYADGKLINLNTALPIKSLDFLYKVNVANGAFTPIDLSAVTIAGDGLSFTIAGAVNGEFYYYAAYYDPSLTTLPTLSYSYTTDLKAQVNGNTEALKGIQQHLNFIDGELSALIGDGWQVWTPTLTWTGTPPATNVVVIARFKKIGRTIRFAFYYKADDGNGATALKISLPVTPLANGMYLPFMAQQKVNTTWSVPMAYMYDTDANGIQFRNLSACTDAQSVEILVSGYYEI